MQEPEYAWRYEAKCAGEDTDMFYPPRDKDKYKTIAAKAKGICLGHDGRKPCPVRVDCLMTALKTNEPHGIWGGLSHRERNALIRKWNKYPARMTLKEFIEKGAP